jgi:serine/threonine-protein kinase
MTITRKIFLAIAAVVAVVLGATVIVSNRAAAGAADALVSETLAATRAQVRATLDARRTALRGGAAVFVQNPNFFAIVANKSGASLFDQSQEAVAQIGADWVQVTDEQGVRLARSDDPSAPADTLVRSALIRGALEGTETSGVAINRDGGLAQAVAVPIRQGADASARIVGVLMAVRGIDSTVARALAREAGSDLGLVFFTADDEGPTARVVTIGNPATLTPELRARDWDPDLPVGTLPRADLTIDGTHYLGQYELLRSASGTPLGGYVVLKSEAAALARFNRLQLLLFGTGAAGLLVAFVLSLVSARTISRPVQALAAAATRAADGDYAAELPPAGRDEIGALNGAFRALLADLREKQQLVDLLQADEARRTVEVNAMTGTLKLAALAPGGLAPGMRFAKRYEVKEVLGAGGMGTVYKALDTELGEVVAIKTLKPDFAAQDERALERFRSEIRLARKISHRNVVRTHDIGEADGTYFITMEYVEGRSLKDLVRQRGPLPPAVVITIGKQLCRALEVAHAAGVIHRDIKPQNIVVGPDGVLKVMDFGIARLATRTEGVTQAGMVVGTPEYMAPEQFLGDDVDARADLYAAGAVLYECLTGRLPHTAETPIVLITKVLEQPITPPRQLVAGIPERLEAAVLAALQRDRALRPASADALHDLVAAAE